MFQAEDIIVVLGVKSEQVYLFSKARERSQVLYQVPVRTLLCGFLQPFHM